MTFEVAGWLGVSNLGMQNAQSGFKTPSHPATSKATISASECRILTFDPPLDVRPRKGLKLNVTYLGVLHAANSNCAGKCLPIKNTLKKLQKLQ